MKVGFQARNILRSGCVRVVVREFRVESVVSKTLLRSGCVRVVVREFRVESVVSRYQFTGLVPELGSSRDRFESILRSVK